MPDVRTRARNDSSRRKPVNGDGVSSGGTPAPVLKHPPLMAHVNECDECLNWLLALSVNYVAGRKVRNATH